MAADVEYWPTHDPTGTEGNREQRLQAYREVCDTPCCASKSALPGPAPGAITRRSGLVRNCARGPGPITTGYGHENEMLRHAPS